jgi:hypothetical protein
LKVKAENITLYGRIRGYKTLGKTQIFWWKIFSFALKIHAEKCYGEKMQFFNMFNKNFYVVAQNFR